MLQVGVTVAEDGATELCCHGIIGQHQKKRPLILIRTFLQNPADSITSRLYSIYLCKQTVPPSACLTYSSVLLAQSSFVWAQANKNLLITRTSELVPRNLGNSSRDPFIYPRRATSTFASQQTKDSHPVHKRAGPSPSSQGSGTFHMVASSAATSSTMEVTSSYTNGYSKSGPGVNGVTNSTPALQRQPSPSRGPTILGRVFNTVARLFTWYAIITLLFRCPPTLDDCDESSPKICRPYFRAKEIVSPHVQPYYDTYAAPYVHLAKPYYETANEHVFTPAKGYIAKYGGPALDQSKEYTQAQWDRTVQPKLAIYQDAVKEQYDRNIAPRVSQLQTAMAPYLDIARTSALQTYYEVIQPSYHFSQPYISHGYTAASQFTTETAVPAVSWAWDKTYVFLDASVWPRLRTLYVENVEPQLARIGKRLGRYSGKSRAAIENISERVSSQTSSFAKPSSPVSTASASNSVSLTSEAQSSIIIESTDIPDAEEVASHDQNEQVVAPAAGENESELRRTARETVAEDLEKWQTKFAKAAEEGADEIEERVWEIVREMIEQNANTMGKALVAALEDTFKAEVERLHKEIVRIVDKGNETGENAEAELVAAVRAAGMSIKKNAQAIRDWKSDFEEGMESAITKAAENHFKILESIRDLALQRIGMKWAWMDGITYKDWTKFHELRDRFDEWTLDLKQLIVTHPALDAAREASAEVEDAGMTVAQAAARELARLKQVALWKLAAGDTTDDFDSENMRRAAEEVQRAKAEEAAAEASRAAEAAEAAEAAAEASRLAEEEAAAASEATEEQPQQATEEVDESSGSSPPEQDPLEEAASVVENESQATDLPDEGVSDALEEDPLESAASVIEDQSPADDLSNNNAGEDEYRVYESISSAASQASSVVLGSSGSNQPDDVVSSPDLASTPLPGDGQTFIVASNDSEPAGDNYSRGRSDTEGQAQVPKQGAEDEVDEHLEDQLDQDMIPESVEDEPVSAETGSVKPVFLGAMAQSVPKREGPILDEDADVDDDETTFHRLSEQAQEAYSNAMSHASEKYAEAMSALSVQIYGTPKPDPTQQEMFASVSGAYAGAIEAANSRLHEVLDAASKKVYGTPTPTATPSHVNWASVEALAAQRLDEGRRWAEEQFEAAKVKLGLATATPSPTPTNAKLLEQAKLNYYAGLGAAHARYSEFLAAAASAFSSLKGTSTPTDAAGTASSVAAVATQSAGAVASGAQQEALSVASVVGGGFDAAASIVGDTVNAAAQEILEAAEAVERGITDTWENVVSQISAQVYGVPTPTPTAWYDGPYQEVEKLAAQAPEQAAKQYEMVYSLVQELVAGKEPTSSESILSRFQAAYATGAAAAGDSVNAAREKLNSAAAAAAEAVREGLHPARDEL
ncbi:hypothetical protein SODALDRAFT_360574 [Sodiomyces alkalinus F11]|uniref:Transcription factor hoxa13 n=1 Tax=Sodiomyces alkalinus (strain CBS 110278 / VKM F-3762 / F11) TaxID=1314773 RepID=A0A3N2PUR1_SODAK|nr:hypothetical protein SODALDRAFT_360574 [Sodiomyces alkalinus F11]ROT38232.1 hypothetical protein SODALDRAFT_360574 [Sodiomyces alkalinus F11]